VTALSRSLLNRIISRRQALLIAPAAWTAGSGTGPARRQAGLLTGRHAGAVRQAGVHSPASWVSCGSASVAVSEAVPVAVPVTVSVVAGSSSARIR
jgi:hypothetical protein